MSKEKKAPWNKGKRKPIVDEDGLKWCNCISPDLVSPVGKGQAYCLKCHTPWYH